MDLLPLACKNDKSILPLGNAALGQNTTTRVYSNLSIFYLIYLFFTAPGSTQALHKLCFGFFLHLLIPGQLLSYLISGCALQIRFAN